VCVRERVRESGYMMKEEEGEGSGGRGKCVCEVKLLMQLEMT